MDGSALLPFASAFIGAVIPVGAFVFKWGKKVGEKAQAMDVCKDEMEALRSQLTMPNGMPSYITRKELYEQIMPEVQAIKSNLDKYRKDQGEIERRILDRLAVIEQKFDGINPEHITV